MKIKKGDTVKVIAGKDRGKSGTVLHAFPREGKVIVEGVGVVRKHERAQRRNSTGQIVERAMPIDVSNVAIMDASGKPSRIGYAVEEGKKHRVVTKTGAKL